MTSETGSRKRTADEVRDGRLRLRSWLWDLDRGSDPGARDYFRLRVAECGRKRVAGMVEIRAGEGTAGLGGLSTCGSAWVCPCCSPGIAQARADEVQTVIRRWQMPDPERGRPDGGSVLLVTLTLQHFRKHRLVQTWDAVTTGWKGVRNARGWRLDKREFGIAGFLRVVETTYGANGWHPHLHVLLFCDRPTSAEDRERLRARIYGRWSSALEGEGYETLEWSKDPDTGKLVPVAVDVRHADPHTVAYLAEYLAKFGYAPTGTADGEHGSWGLAREVMRGDLKRGRRGSRSPWEILESAAAGSDDDRALWLEWERVSKGRRQYSWARGFLESLGLEALDQRTDEERAGDEVRELEVVALLPGSSWAKLVADLRRLRNLAGAPLLSRTLSKAAHLEPAEFRAWLRSAGVEYLHPDSVAIVETVDRVTGEILVRDALRGPGTAPLAPVARRTWKGRRQAQRALEARRLGLRKAPTSGTSADSLCLRVAGLAAERDSARS